MNVEENSQENEMNSVIPRACTVNVPVSIKRDEVLNDHNINMLSDRLVSLYCQHQRNHEVITNDILNSYKLNGQDSMTIQQLPPPLQIEPLTSKIPSSASLSSSTSSELILNPLLDLSYRKKFNTLADITNNVPDKMCGFTNVQNVLGPKETAVITDNPICHLKSKHVKWAPSPPLPEVLVANNSEINFLPIEDNISSDDLYEYQNYAKQLNKPNTISGISVEDSIIAINDESNVSIDDSIKSTKEWLWSCLTLLLVMAVLTIMFSYFIIVSLDTPNKCYNFIAPEYIALNNSKIKTSQIRTYKRSNIC